MLGMMRWRSVAKVLLVVMFMGWLGLGGWGDRSSDGMAIAAPRATAKVSNKVFETAPPPLIADLQAEFADNQPQVKILEPKANEVLPDNTVSVRFQVKDLSIFKNEQFGLGPHLHVILDNQTYQAVYDLSRPLVLENLSPGTHTLRAFASRPWHESFKNDGAYAQVTFHVYTKTSENQPDPEQPLLTYSRPQGTYGAEPIMLDFYLTNAPLHLVAQEDDQDDLPDWRIRVTVNGNDFVLDQWEPLYLQGFKPEKNWVKLDYIDEQGNPINNLYSNTARLITLEPGGQDGLSRIVRGDVSLAEARAIADPTYTPPAPPAPVVIPTPAPPAPVVKPSPAPMAKPSPVPSPAATPSPVDPGIAPAPVLPQKASPAVRDPSQDLIPAPTPSPAPSPAPAAIAPQAKRPSKSPSLLRPRSTPAPAAPAEQIAAPDETTVQPAPARPQFKKPEFLNRFQRSAPPVPVKPLPAAPSAAPSASQDAPPVEPVTTSVPETRPGRSRFSSRFPTAPKPAPQGESPMSPDSESGKSESGKSEPGKSEPGKSEPSIAPPKRTKLEPAAAMQSQSAPSPESTESAQSGLAQPAKPAQAGAPPATGKNPAPAAPNSGPSDFQGLLNRLRRSATDLRQKASDLKDQAATLKIPTLQELPQRDRRPAAPLSEDPGVTPEES